MILPSPDRAVAAKVVSRRTASWGGELCERFASAVPWNVRSSWAGPQAMCAPEVVGEGLQENHASDLGHRAHPHDAETAALEDAVDRLDTRAALVDRFAGLIGHALAPGLDRIGLASALPISLALALRIGIRLVGRHGRVDRDVLRSLRDKIVIGGVGRVDQA